MRFGSGAFLYCLYSTKKHCLKIVKARNCPNMNIPTEHGAGVNGLRFGNVDANMS